MYATQSRPLTVQADGGGPHSIADLPKAISFTASFAPALKRPDCPRSLGGVDCLTDIPRLFDAATIAINSQTTFVRGTQNLSPANPVFEPGSRRIRTVPYGRTE